MLFIPVSSLPSELKRSCCYLLSDNWDDYSFQTSFVLHYVDQSGEKLNVGGVKITFLGQQKGMRTSFSAPFEHLGPNFCSLGSSQGYYEELMTLDEKVRRAILEALNDCVADQSLLSSFANEPAFNTSLLRDSNVENMLNWFGTILAGNAIPSSYDFTYTVSEASGQKIEVNVLPKSLPPSNVHVLIGRNGVGKTRILSGISDALTENPSPNEFGLVGDIEFTRNLGMFTRGVPIADGFANLVTVAFSVFDGFTPIPQGQVIGKTRYDYVGLRKEGSSGEFKGSDELNDEFRKALSECLTGLKLERWQRVVGILGSDPVFAEYDFPVVALQDNALEIISNSFSKLSSGHKIILLAVTRLVQLVDERTLVLIDEPENHLHPPLLSSFVRAISELMIRRNGVALIATHSPVVLQEVPKSCVTFVDKVRNEYCFSRPDTETFAESVGTLTKEVFNLEVAHSGYHALLKAHMDEMSYEEMLRAFKKQVGREGRTIARSLEIIKSSGTE